MVFKSLLFIKGDTTKESPNSINDLRLNQIVEAISKYAKDASYVKKILYERLTDKDDILYRQDILKDIEKTEIFNAINNFSNNMSITFEYLESSKKERCKITGQGWFLEAVLKYISTVEEIDAALHSESLESEGLKGAAEYLKDYKSSDSFKQLKEAAETINSKLANIQFNITIKENRVSVSNFNGEKDLNKDISALFDRFIEHNRETIELKLTQTAILSNVEERILEYVEKLNPEPFHELDGFFKTNQQFIDSGIKQLYKELDFYLTFLEFIKPLKEKGYSFSFPAIVKKCETLQCKNGFDLALALQLQKSNQRVITNDFYLEKGEKLFLVSGPNQGGKTTFARMVGQLFYLSLLGLKVPASEASLFVCDHIYTHFEKEERVENKRGKLEDELLRAKKILNSATEKSVIIINEIFSATSLEDGYFLGSFLLKKIISIGAFCVFVTFMQKLVELDKSIVPLTSTVEPDNPAIRTFKIVRREQFGKSYAVYLAQKYCLTYDCLKERLRNR